MASGTVDIDVLQTGSFSAASGYTANGVSLQKIGRVVFISGAIFKSSGTFGNGPTQVATVASGFRPKANYETGALVNEKWTGAMCKAEITTDGKVNVQVVGSLPTWVNIVASYISE